MSLDTLQSPRHDATTLTVSCELAERYVQDTSTERASTVACPCTVLDTKIQLKIKNFHDTCRSFVRQVLSIPSLNIDSILLHDFSP